MRKSSLLLVPGGGLVALAAFFLPFFASSWWASGRRMLYLTQHPGISSQAFFWAEPFAAVFLLVFGVLMLRLGKMAALWSLGSVLLGLVFLIGTVFFFAGLPIEFPLNSGQRQVGFSAVVSLLGSGYWLAAAGFLLGAVGATLALKWSQPAPAWGADSAPEASPEGVPVLQPALLLAVLGGGAAAVAFFLPIFDQFGTAPSWFGGMGEGGLVYITWFWPEPVGAGVLLLAGGLALRRGTFATRWVLSSAGVGLAFLLWFFLLMCLLAGTPTAPLDELSAGYWVAVAGFLVAGLGTLLPVRQQPALEVSGG